ncbi:MAG: (S)-2-hydroxyglutarate dehydrogenase [Frankiaceae bacterium]|jgi:L-2-hydroxyglutarate oxidase|nr:(S)-2-hydroxyglutarate dehydrogenase [Frankiaceae bacterium]MDT7550759.1 (S)-2-hydroxyglutarate dehydrogenase [Actinomycetota bacterium]
MDGDDRSSQVLRFAVVGGGILGAAVARQLLLTDPGASVTLFEKEADFALHQTGRNSGVVHAGLYYTPGSLKAQLCRRGGGMLRDFCVEHDIAYRMCGKVLVALDEQDRARLAGIADRAQKNGVPGVRHLSSGQLRDLEPHVAGIGGLHSPTTAIVDFVAVTRRLAADAEARGAVLRRGSRVTGLRNRGSEAILTAGAYEGAFDQIIVCAGLQADRLAMAAGDGTDPRVVPFRGEYYRLRAEKRDLVRGLVYPVPDPRFPFLGVHLTPRVDGEVLIGPNAVLALSREGYRRFDVSGRDLWDIVRYQGFRRFARANWRTGLAEVRGSVSKAAFAAAARRYVPQLVDDDMIPGPAGIRAQAMDRAGTLLDDFCITTQGRILSVRNAPSPAATSALAIAEHVVGVAAGER